MAKLRATAAAVGVSPHAASTSFVDGGLAPPTGEATSFSALAQGLRVESPGRAAITAATYRAEADCLPPLAALAQLDEAAAARARATATTLVTQLRASRRAGPVEPLLREYALSAPEGVALMCLAEALLRIPDAATRDDLIRDKIGQGDWRRHLGASPSLFVNATSWALMVTGKLTATASEDGLGTALTRLIGRGGEPVIRAAVQLAMRVLGQSFVAGQTIGEALGRAKAWEAKGFTYSYDMLGEAAVTAEDAARYFASYEAAIHAIGAAARGADVTTRREFRSNSRRCTRAMNGRSMGVLWRNWRRACWR